MKQQGELVVTVVVSLAFMACAREAAMDSPAMQSMHEPVEMRELGYAQTKVAAAPPPAAASPSDFWAQQKLIRTARMSLEVGEIEEAIVEVETAVEVRGGIVSDSNRWRSDETRESANLTLRVPSEALDALLADLREVGKVRDEGISSEDVTKAYFDLETRLSVKRQTEARLRELLATPGAELADLVAVERELDRVVTEIETMLGQKRFYDERIALSTVNVSLEERGAFVRPGAFAPVGRALRESFHVLGRSLAGLISFAILALPWLVVLIVLWQLARWWRRRGRPR